MVDLTKLGKIELIEEFDIIISEWQKCLKVINSYNEKISKLKNKKEEISSDIRTKLNIRERSFKNSEAKRKLYKLEEKLENFGCFVFVAYILIMSFIIFNIIKISIIPKIILFSIIILGINIGKRFKKFDNIYDKVICIIFAPAALLSGVTFIHIMNKKLSDKYEKIMHEFSQELEKNKEYQEIDSKVESLQNKIQQVYINFNEFRNKRNNLAAKYQGYEHLLKDYLENGTADDFKEALLRLEEKIHRDKMLNAQEEMRAQMNGMRHQLARQSNQLARQSNQLANQSNELSYQSKRIATLDAEVSSLKY